AAPTTARCPLSLHDALPISKKVGSADVCQEVEERTRQGPHPTKNPVQLLHELVRGQHPKVLPQILDEGSHGSHDDVAVVKPLLRSEEHTSELQSREKLVCRL